MDFILGPGVHKNLYRFAAVTFMPIDKVAVPFQPPYTTDEIINFLVSQSYRGIVFIDDSLSENNACYVTKEQLMSGVSSYDE